MEFRWKNKIGGSMKKRIIVGVFLIVGIIGLIFYFLYPKIALLNAFSHFKKLESAHVEGSFILGNDDFKFNLTGNANYNDGSIYSQMETNYLWSSLKVSMYFLSGKKKSNFYLTTNLSNDWYVSKKDKNENFQKKDISIKDIHIKKVKSDKKGNLKFEVKIPKETFFSFFSNYLEDMDYEEDTILLYLYVKNQKITGLMMEKGKRIYLSRKSNLYLENADLVISSWNHISSISIPEDIDENSKPLNDDKLDVLFQEEN